MPFIDFQFKLDKEQPNTDVLNCQENKECNYSKQANSNNKGQENNGQNQFNRRRHIVVFKLKQNLIQNAEIIAWFS